MNSKKVRILFKEWFGKWSIRRSSWTTTMTRILCDCCTSFGCMPLLLGSGARYYACRPKIAHPILPPNKSSCTTPMRTSRIHVLVGGICSSDIHFDPTALVAHAWKAWLFVSCQVCLLELQTCLSTFQLLAFRPWCFFLKSYGMSTTKYGSLETHDFCCTSLCVVCVHALLSSPFKQFGPCWTSIKWQHTHNRPGHVHLHHPTPVICQRSRQPDMQPHSETMRLHSQPTNSGKLYNLGQVLPRLFRWAVSSLAYFVISYKAVLPVDDITSSTSYLIDLECTCTVHCTPY